MAAFGFLLGVADWGQAVVAGAVYNTALAFDIRKWGVSECTEGTGMRLA